MSEWVQEESKTDLTKDKAVLETPISQTTMGVDTFIDEESEDQGPKVMRVRKRNGDLEAVM